MLIEYLQREPAAAEPAAAHGEPPAAQGEAAAAEPAAAQGEPPAAQGEPPAAQREPPAAQGELRAAMLAGPRPTQIACGPGPILPGRPLTSKILGLDQEHRRPNPKLFCRRCSRH